MCGPVKAVSGGVTTTQPCRAIGHWKLSWWEQSSLGDDPSLFPTPLCQLVCSQSVLLRALPLSKMKSPTKPVGKLLESPVFSLLAGSWGFALKGCLE